MGLDDLFQTEDAANLYGQVSVADLVDQGLQRHGHEVCDAARIGRQRYARGNDVHRRKVRQRPSVSHHTTKVVRTAPGKATITGDLTMHGVTRPVQLEASFNGSGVNPLDKNYTVGFDATATLTRSDFGVKTYLPMIGDETSVRISAAFEKAK